MELAIRCVKCHSPNVIFSKKKQAYVCEDCSYESKEYGQPQNKRIFISYGHDSYTELAERLKSDLLAKGYNVWFDLDRIKSGTDWEAYIEEGLEWVSGVAGGRFTLLMTPYSVRRPDGYCLNELARAVQKGISIVPIMVAWCEPPISICRIQWLDMQDCVPLAERQDRYGIKLERLIEALEDEKLDYEGAQSRLVSLLEPLPFDADIARHISHFIGREWIFDRIDAWLKDDKAPRIFWITGPPGIGKTAIASWLCYKYREVGASHFCRFGHIQRTDPRRFVLSIAYQLSTQLPEYQERLKNLRLEQIVHNLDTQAIFDLLVVQPLSGNFPHPDRTILIVIDALDEAARDDRNELAELIAMEFTKTPSWLRLVVTSRYDQEVAYLLQGFRPYVMEATTPENNEDIRRYLTRELAKYLDNGEASRPGIDTIVARSGGIFLYAEQVNQELAQGNLTMGKVEDFPQGLGGVYVQYFKRQFSDLRFYKNSVRPLLEVITVAQEPLTADFIASIFHWNDYESEETFRTLGSLFPAVDGAIKPFHRTLTDWITNKQRAGPYFVSESEGHRRLVDFGLQEYRKGVTGMSRYMLAYLPFHMISLGLWDELKGLLTDPVFFDQSWNIGQHNIKMYWTQVEERTPLKVVDAYRHVLDAPSRFKGYFVWKIAILLADMGYVPDSASLYEYLIEHYRRAGDFANLQACIGNLSMLTQKGGDRGGGSGDQANFICTPDDKRALIATLNNQANNYYMNGRLELAMDLFKEVERLCREIGDKHELSVCLNNRARIYYIRGNADSAMSILKDIEAICREVGNLNGLSISLNNQALFLYESGDLEKAMGLFKESESISREQNNKNGLLISMDNQANILYDYGELDTALKLYKEVEKLCLELNNRTGLHISLGNQAIVLYDRGDLEGSLKLHKEEERICRELGDKVGLEGALNAQGVIFYDRGDLDGALKLFKEAESLCRSLGHKAGLQNSIGNQALILYDRGDLEGARGLHAEEETICRELGNKQGLQTSLCNLAYILYKTDRIDEAMTLFSGAEKEFMRFKNVIGSAGCLSGIALILRYKGDPEGAMKLLKDSESKYRRADYKKGLQACLGNQAAALYDLGETDRSFKLLKEVENICREIGHKEGLAISLMDQAIIDIDNNRPEDALSRSGEACGIVMGCGMKALEGQMRPLSRSIGAKAAQRKLPATNSAVKNKAIRGTPKLLGWPVKNTKQEKK